MQSSSGGQRMLATMDGIASVLSSITSDVYTRAKSELFLFKHKQQQNPLLGNNNEWISWNSRELTLEAFHWAEMIQTVIVSQFSSRSLHAWCPWHVEIYWTKRPHSWRWSLVTRWVQRSGSPAAFHYQPSSPFTSGLNTARSMLVFRSAGWVWITTHKISKSAAEAEVSAFGDPILRILICIFIPNQ